MTDTLVEETKRERHNRLKRERLARNREKLNADRQAKNEAKIAERARQRAENDALLILEADFLLGTDTQDSIARRLGFKDATGLRKKLDTLGESELSGKYWVKTLRNYRDD